MLKEKYIIFIGGIRDTLILIMFDETGNVVPTRGILEIKLSNSDDYLRVLREFKSVNGWAFY